MFTKEQVLPLRVITYPKFVNVSTSVWVIVLSILRSPLAQASLISLYT